MLKHVRTAEVASPIGAAKATGAAVVSLGRGSRGFAGVVASVGQAGRSPPSGGIDPAELERRLLEIGFVEGARVEILHEGAFGGDPIAVKLDDMRVALRRREADAVMVAVQARGAGPGRPA